MRLPPHFIRPTFTTLLCFLAGLLTIVLAIPRFVAAVSAIPGDAVRFELSAQNSVGDASLELLIDNRRLALQWVEDPSYLRDIGTAATLLSFRLQAADPSRNARLEESEEALLDGLRLAPVDPYSWTRLAYVRLQRGTDAKAVIVALRMSLLTGRYDPELTKFRLSLALPLWSLLAAEDRRVFMAQLRILWRDAPPDVAQLAADPPAYAIVIQALSAVPSAIDRLQRLRQQLRSS
jgi:hypothetical protein